MLKNYIKEGQKLPLFGVGSYIVYGAGVLGGNLASNLYWQGFAIAFGLMVWIGAYDTLFLDWVLFANMKLFRLEGTEHETCGYKNAWAKEIIDALGVDVSKYDPFLSHEGVVARTILYKNELKRLIENYIDALCINLGCGFDDKFSQVDNGSITWFDVDLPDQIEKRRKVYSDRDRCTMLEGSALDGEWTKQLPKHDMNIVVMEGVLEYFSKDQVKTCLNMLCDSFEHGYLLAELHSPFLEKNGSHHDAVKHTNATFGWGTKSGLDYLELEPRMRLISETSYNEEMKKYSIRGKIFAIVGKNINNRLAVFEW